MNEAIAIIKDARQSHVEWVAFADSIEDHDCEECHYALTIAGGKKWHEDWVRKYDHVLEILGAQ